MILEPSIPWTAPQARWRAGGEHEAGPERSEARARRAGGRKRAQASEEEGRPGESRGVLPSGCARIHRLTRRRR